VPNCTRDEGGPFGVGDHGLISSHCKLVWSRALVVSVAAKSGQDAQAGGTILSKCEISRCRVIETMAKEATGVGALTSLPGVSAAISN
jgi:hypothetical protein